MRISALITLLIVSFTLVGCGSASSASSAATQSAPSPSLNVRETGSENPDTVTETIHMNNCGGKADVKQTAERSLIITLEGESSLGVDAQVVRANVSARYAESKGVSKSIELTASSGTDMEFTVAWTEQQWLGTITSSIGSSQAKYRARVPVAVELVASRDLGTCAGGGAAQVENNQPPVSTSTTIQSSPQPTLLADTRLGTILEVGQSWHQGEYEVNMVQYALTEEYIWIGFDLTSKKYTPVILEYSMKGLSAIDSKGRDVRIDHGNNYQCEDQRIKLEPKQTVFMDCHGGGNFYVYADLPNPSITEIIVSLSGTLGIDNARWRIPVAH